ncbi:DUF4169 family protein [Phyllobacterium sp. 21LDTY02-6]|uniref:DUF4169 family protein n=1 Tax=Phyllobacterium sp. 21LDTY02-6 TaxID=2944903 RepID=UPI0020224933|nr:DUF4169 family protein [Phyllobacterium sp. 21LDTY02-6]MCO4316005.1 DUF4169 family protein [Phyllobacterium sp. 21LDTY02-6]
MAEIVNLRQARKRREKAAREQAAAENRVVFGQTKAEKRLRATLAQKDEKFLDDSRRERPDAGKDADKDAGRDADKDDA